MSEKELEEMVSLLDPSRDYGTYRYDEIVEGIHDGTIRAFPGHPVPILRKNGISIKGSGAPLALVASSNKRPWVKEFEDRGSADFATIYEALLQSALGGDVKAQMYFMDRMLGKPRETRESSSTDWSSIIGALAVERLVDVKQPMATPITIIDSLD
jgi:hypothetical protein